jgi:hypothetical protein
MEARGRDRGANRGDAQPIRLDPSPVPGPHSVPGPGRPAVDRNPALGDGPVRLPAQDSARAAAGGTCSRGTRPPSPWLVAVIEAALRSTLCRKFMPRTVTVVYQLVWYE